MNALTSERKSGTSVRTRLLQAFSVLLAFLLLVSVLSLQRFDELTTTIEELVDDRARRVMLAQKANHQAQNASIYLLRLLQTPTREQRVPLYLNMDAALAASDAAIRTLTRDTPSSLTAEVVTLRQQYGELFQLTVEQIEISGLETARQHFEQHTDQVLQDLLAATFRLAENQQDFMHAEAERLKVMISDTRLIIMLILFSSLLVSAGLAVLVAKSLSDPLQRAVKVAAAVAAGNYSKQIPTSNLIEIRRLLRSLSRMRDSIVQREQRIWRLAYTDSLTELPNRTQFLEQLSKAVKEGCGVLALLDLNRFAQINNALGHEVGDELLQAVAGRLSECIQVPHLVARLDSDEFAILLRDIEVEKAKPEIMAIMQQLRDPIELQGQRLDMDASVGVACFPADGQSASVLLKRANIALKAAKRRHESCAFAAEFTLPEPHEHLSLLGEMRQALQRDEFTLHYQPKYDARSKRVSAVEALVRWQHPERGMVAPGVFIPFAEQTGFVRNITPWVISRALGDLVEWRRQGVELVVSVNISALDLMSADLVTQIQQQLVCHSLPPSQLCLEITESALMNDPETAQLHLEQLSGLGVRLSIDDYGAGHASLAYVRDLPVDELKIDRAFVSGIDQSSRNAAIVWSTILLCRELGLRVVAEGVETESESEWLIAHDCDLLQGYGIARPMNSDRLLHWLSVQKPVEAG
ncbi:bifunctional diguanylate cyclase/phosphodiesterase [Marinobacterium sp. MBR-109]|jgi:diguanylate cyclase (GGDEF)-like protein|uniref:putative bifunctional diguanylate cyclase/phosphodiesterase n=1 Tax=Marinobacterium sp. MBR-109 TaxID=3156462 RepID=UPI00339590A9